MSRKLTASTALLLTAAPLLWAGNAIVGRLVREAVPPMTLNLLRWSLALLILLPLGRAVFVRGSGVLRGWRRYSLLGLFGVGLYNALQYLALQTSTPINVTLVAAGMPVWMMLVGALFFHAPLRRRQIVGALLSIAGVLLVLARGDWQQLLALRLVPGDLFMVLATICWSFYSWLLIQPQDRPALRADWAAFLLAQVMYGVVWSGALAAVEWGSGPRHIAWSWQLAAVLAFVAIGPALTAFRCWGAGVQRAGPTIAAFFSNLTPLFAALMSLAFLHEAPHLYHLAAFALIVGGIAWSSRAA
ncbi:DMT family transporter [Massilia sp. DWR3-1-1]|uniref:DMT family transporter n=1 Tax=Massilia sp. DWR3-1-1 TaxID=2804559 RepID=UPI003CEB5B08